MSPSESETERPTHMTQAGGTKARSYSITPTLKIFCISHREPAAYRKVFAPFARVCGSGMLRADARFEKSLAHAGRRQQPRHGNCAGLSA